MPPTLADVLPHISIFLEPNPSYLTLASSCKIFHTITPLLPLPPAFLLQKHLLHPSVDNVDDALHRLPLLATGTYSTVRLLSHPLFQRTQLAVKLLPKRLQVRLENVQRLRREVLLLRTLAVAKSTKSTKSTATFSTQPLHLHPFISHIATIHSDAHLAVVTDLSVGGELFTHLHHKNQQTSCTLNVTKFYVTQLILALEHLHMVFPHAAVLHRDLRQENILVSESSYLKLCDFGNARMLKKGARAKTMCGVPESTAPEMFIPNGRGATSHGPAVDWWALGILCYELNVGCSPFYSDNPMDIYARILASPGTLNYPDGDGSDETMEKQWNLARQFTLLLLARDETQRLGPRDGRPAELTAGNHAWFDGTDWNRLAMQTQEPPRGSFFPSHDLRRNFELIAFDPEEEDPPAPLRSANAKMIWKRWAGTL